MALALVAGLNTASTYKAGSSNAHSTKSTGEPKKKKKRDKSPKGQSVYHDHCVNKCLICDVIGEKKISVSIVEKYTLNPDH